MSSFYHLFVIIIANISWEASLMEG